MVRNPHGRQISSGVPQGSVLGVRTHSFSDIY